MATIDIMHAADSSDTTRTGHRDQQTRNLRTSMRPLSPIAIFSALLVTALLLVGGRAHAQTSCSTATNTCFTPNLIAPGCNNPDCCGLVCTIEPTCCDLAWDDVCVAIAQKYCSSCGAVPESCFTPHPSPSCNNGVICQAVCEVLGFEYCCQLQWDAACVQQAIKLTDTCGEPATGSCLVVHENPNCNDTTCCSRVCTIDPACCATSWDQSCVAWADRFCFSCGNPRAGNCCHQNETPYCNDRVCCETVCAADQFCCETRWDTLCGEVATEVCGQCERVCGYTDPANPSARSCRTVHTQPGCSDAICCDSVCYIDNFCCSVNWDFTCVEAARATCALSNNPDINALCSTANGSCFIPHHSAGCSDAACCSIVCTADPTCCDILAGSWDVACAQRASIACNGCGNITAGSCFYPHGSPSCLDRQCCIDVCDLDPTCCDTLWDIFCASSATTICTTGAITCGDPRTRPCSLASYLPACEDANCCSKICDIDPTCCSRAWDETCAANANVICASPAGCPGTGSALAVHGTNGCSDPECCSAVCSVDPICCTFGWSERCVTIAKGICWSFGGCPGDGPCDVIHLTPGCSDSTCCSVVCEADPLCCDVQWNSVCVSAARNLCQPLAAWQCPCTGSCFEEHPETAGCEDEVCCSGVCHIDPLCCTESWDSGCATMARVVCCGAPGCGDNCAGECLRPHLTPNCNDPACCEAVCRFEPYCCEVRWDSACVLAARSTCVGGCGQPSSGNCFNGHDTPGCSIGNCCETVCGDARFQYCCDISWDEACATEARTACEVYLPSCGDIGSDGCNIPHLKPACSDRTCCDGVCLIDDYCCTNEWDATCVQLTYTADGCGRYQFKCGDVCAGDCCDAHPTPWCNDLVCCEAVCLVDIFCCTSAWDAFCASTARVNTACETVCPDPPCGTPEAGNCCFPHENANCNDQDCCDAVCKIDALCCQTVWDSICAAQAAQACTLCGGGLSCGDAAAGSCCNEHAKPFCSDAKCCSIVCSFDETCCITAWDTTCVKLAQAFCGCGN
ncbi:MAG: hypothetical protein RLZZ36_2056 [Pseudomonadota bacterium]